MANVGYVRVSTKEQNTGRQFVDFANKGIKLEKTYTEKITGKNTNRPQLKAMLDYVREGDTVYVESISRLARNTKDFLNILEELQDRKVALVSLKEKIDTTTPQGRFIVSVFASLAQLERETIRERQREGIDLALSESRPYGRPKVAIDETFVQAYKDLKAGKLQTSVQAMKQAGMKPNTWYRRVKEYEAEQTHNKRKHTKK
jgi:DNA invertase Pin-like site-specific DNA recombinase